MMGSKKPGKTMPAPFVPTKLPVQKPIQLPKELIPDRVDGEPVSPKKMPSNPNKK